MPPSNQQWNLVLNVRGRFTWLFLCKSDPRHICLSFLIIFPIKIVFTSGLFSCLVWYIGCHQVEAACEIILRCRPATRTWLSNCFSVWFLLYWLLISYYLNFFGLWFMNMSLSFRLSGVIFCNIWYSMLNCLVIVQGFNIVCFCFIHWLFSKFFYLKGICCELERQSVQINPTAWAYDTSSSLKFLLLLHWRFFWLETCSIHNKQILDIFDNWNHFPKIRSIFMIKKALFGN